MAFFGLRFPLVIGRADEKFADGSDLLASAIPKTVIEDTDSFTVIP